ncbi:hypothetical protein SISSUDRAFT_843635 [Sistotremastrum suecicum HHB10207 ss-3]|uniref:FAD/NAD(P)-binding domain-containing protein n=1 Tax=Sistotremastrum suecicum HHB10207 ss-3 TaxID=1314776 RepID=A0A166HHT7_9AGAM|nr:hypothetical protein SISSUDRAFT_843635 [Sistotremastrum suecicum HHB10207 ss-3]
MPRKVKVAIVGSGLAGLTAASLLSTTDTSESNTEFECHLFEKEDEIGMDASSVSMLHPTADGKAKKEWRVDVPMRSFQGGYYKQLISMYKAKGIGFRPNNFSYSFSWLYPSFKSHSITSTLIYNGASGRSGFGIPSALMNVAKPSTGISGGLKRFIPTIAAFIIFVLTILELLCNQLRLVFYSMPYLRPSPFVTFEEWIDYSTPKGSVSHWMGFDESWRRFCHDILVPLFSAVTSAPRKDVLRHPVPEFLEYVWLTLFTDHYVVNQGVRQVVSTLSKPLENIHLSASIIDITVDEDGNASMHCTNGTSTTVYSGFSHIIFATQANAAASILTTYAKSLTKPNQHATDLIQCLSKFTYIPTIVINHTDHTLLPDDYRDWRDLNMITLPHDQDFTEEMKEHSPEYRVAPECTMATHMLSKPSDCHPSFPTVFQTTNPVIPPQESRILSVGRLDRALLTVESKKALQELSYEDKKWWQTPGNGTFRLGRLQGGPEEGPRIWICGAYAYTGIPLLEGCVCSARNVVEQGIFRAEGVVVKNQPW